MHFIHIMLYNIKYRIRKKSISIPIKLLVEAKTHQL